MPFGWHLGIIGGSGLADGLELDEAQVINVRSAFGEPSGPVITGRLGNSRVTFLARHGAGHLLPPSAVNYRANIEVLKRCGVTDVLALSAVGSLREELAPGHFVTVDQFIDRTCRREGSFFESGMVAHVSLADPVCPRLTRLTAEATRAVSGLVHEGRCYIAIEGPQFSTRAESLLYREWGADIIGMTAMPEARLAREAELPYALLAMVTDYDSWRVNEPSVRASDIFDLMQANAALARTAVRQLIERLPPDRESSPIDTCLDHALVTAASKRDQRVLDKLGSIAGRAVAPHL